MSPPDELEKVKISDSNVPTTAFGSFMSAAKVRAEHAMVIVSTAASESATKGREIATESREIVIQGSEIATKMASNSVGKSSDIAAVVATESAVKVKDVSDYMAVKGKDFFTNFSNIAARGKDTCVDIAAYPWNKCSDAASRIGTEFTSKKDYCANSVAGYRDRTAQMASDSISKCKEFAGGASDDCKDTVRTVAVTVFCYTTGGVGFFYGFKNAAFYSVSQFLFNSNSERITTVKKVMSRTAATRRIIDSSVTRRLVDSTTKDVRNMKVKAVVYLSYSFGVSLYLGRNIIKDRINRMFSGSGTD